MNLGRPLSDAVDRAIAGLSRTWRKVQLAPGVPIALGSVAILAVVTHLSLTNVETVWVEINGRWVQHKTRESSAEAILREMGIETLPEDWAILPPIDRLRAGEPICLTLARPVNLITGDEVTTGYTHGRTVIEAISDLSINPRPEDALFLEGRECGPHEPLPPVTLSRADAQGIVEAWRRPVTLSLERASLLRVYEGEQVQTLWTTARTVGEALYEKGIVIYAGDQILPSPGARLRSGQSVYLRRATPVVMDVGGEVQALRTLSRSVGELLTERGVTVDEDDRVYPGMDAPVTAGAMVRVVLVSDQYFVEEEPVPFQVVEVPDPEMEIDNREVTRWGQEGAKRKQVRVHYENGREVARTYEEEWLEREPVERIISYGTKIVLRELQTPEGTFTYWRKLRMLATSYNAATAGTPISAPNYGFTRLGWPARKGVIAVDPQVVPLGQRMYVPGYGLGTAADTGGAINWRRIDLCYDDSNLVFWNQWVDVYLLAPVPPRDRILWQVPNLPPEQG